MFFDPLSPEFRANPYPYYDMMRQSAPIFYLPEWNMWFCTRYEDCTALLRDNRLGHEILRVISREELGWEPEDELPPAYLHLRQMQSKWMLFRDPPHHTRLKGLVHKAFTPRMVEKLRGRIETITAQLIEAQQDEMDLIADFAIPLPVTVIAEMLGVPLQDQADFRRWSNDLAGTLDLTGGAPEIWDRAAIAAVEFDTYFRKLVADRRKYPQDDLLTALVEAEEDGDKLTEDELIATCILLLIAGHETTVNLIGNGMMALMNNPDQLDRLRENPDLIRNTVEELLRYDSPVQMTSRWALEDIQYGDVTFKKGHQVALMFAAANRDDEMFPNASKLDITRENANKHLSFGNGIHFCLGAPLARLEGQIAIQTLIQCFPNIRIKPNAEIRHRKQYILRGVESLPVILK
ncbi:MAG: cytochrome P450 [Chloroflexi bacterium]|nr:MAG: cytochrome P450 [Chloroflexota bacterium]